MQAGSALIHLLSFLFLLEDLGVKNLFNLFAGLFCLTMGGVLFDWEVIDYANLFLAALNFWLFFDANYTVGNLCWHQWKDFELKDYPVKEQWCIHCGNWRSKQQ